MKGGEPALRLIIELGDMRRQQPMQVERVAFGLGERGALIEQGIVEQLVAAQRGFDVVAGGVLRCGHAPYDSCERRVPTEYSAVVSTQPDEQRRGACARRRRRRPS